MRARLTFLHVIAPVVIGGLIYVLWRSDRLEVQRWIASLGLRAFVDRARSDAHAASAFLPNWTLVNLPDALWVYAVTSAMRLVWQGEAGLGRTVWIGTGVALAIGSEFGQLLQIVPGTFDMYDLLAYALGFLLSCALIPESAIGEGKG